MFVGSPVEADEKEVSHYQVVLVFVCLSFLEHKPFYDDKVSFLCVTVKFTTMLDFGSSHSDVSSVL